MGEAKRKNQRDCPALGKRITSRECGENRIETYDCPEECPHHPFGVAQYDRFLEVESRLTSWINKQLLKEGWTLDARDLPEPEEWGPEETDVLLLRLQQKAFLRGDGEEPSPAERWQEDPPPGLVRDEAKLFRGFTTIRPALVEVRTILDSERVQVRLLTEDPDTDRILVDRSLAASLARFDCLLTPVYDAPFFLRTFGMARIWSSIPPFDERETLQQVIAWQGGPAEPGAEQRDWLAHHIEEVFAAHRTLEQARRVRAFQNSDMIDGSVVYQLRMPADTWVAIANDHPELSVAEPGPGATLAWNWWAGEANARGLTENLGTLALEEDRLRLHSFTRRNLAALQHKLEDLGGDQLEKIEERIVDTAQQQAHRNLGNLGNLDLDTIPTHFLQSLTSLFWENAVLPAAEREDEEPAETPLEALQRTLDRHWESWLEDREIPALEGSTPREAAHQPEKRPILLQLMKTAVNTEDRKALEGKAHMPLGPILRELGLHEIDTPAPPERAPIAGEEGSSPLPPHEGEENKTPPPEELRHGVPPWRTTIESRNEGWERLEDLFLYTEQAMENHQLLHRQWIEEATVQITPLVEDFLPAYSPDFHLRAAYGLAHRLLILTGTGQYFTPIAFTTEELHEHLEAIAREDLDSDTDGPGLFDRVRQSLLSIPLAASVFDQLEDWSRTMDDPSLAPDVDDFDSMIVVALAAVDLLDTRLTPPR